MNKPLKVWRGYPIFLSDVKPKKYFALVDNKKVYFGDARYEQYFDKIGHFSDKNHNDEKRRENYKRRMEKNRHIKESPGWFADQILW
jgi:hypothetical protein